MTVISFKALSEEHQLTYIEHIKLLGSGDIAPNCASAGLCEELMILGFKLRHTGGIRLSIAGSYPYWPKWTNMNAFPVPSTQADLSPSKLFLSYNRNESPNYNKSMWIGEYGELRKELCLHVSQYLLGSFLAAKLGDREYLKDA